MHWGAVVLYTTCIHSPLAPDPEQFSDGLGANANPPRWFLGALGVKLKTLLLGFPHTLNGRHPSEVEGALRGALGVTPSELWLVVGRELGLVGLGLHLEGPYRWCKAPSYRLGTRSHDLGCPSAHLYI